MDRPDIKLICINSQKTIREALENIQEHGLGFVFLIDGQSKYLGLVTDGDIRRALIAGQDLNSKVEVARPASSTTLPISTSNEKIQNTLNDTIRVIPLLDENGRAVDYAIRSQFRRIPVLEPLLDANELSYVTECIRTNWISSQGAFVTRFEKMVGDYIGVENAVATANGTVALHLALVSLGIQPGDEVIVPDLTFAATINAVIYAGAKPVLVDIEPETWGLDVAKFEKAITAKTRAVIPVHLYGQPCRIEEICKIAQKKNIKVVEDCAEAFGSRVKGRPVGSFGDAAMFSFFGNKTITTGEGGMVLFKEAKVSERARRLRDHGMSKEKRYWHDEVGFNYRMTNLQAAIGVAQMERAELFINTKLKIGSTYNEILGRCPAVVLPPQLPWSLNTYWVYTVRLNPAAKVSSGKMLETLLAGGVEGRRIFYPLHQMPPYQLYALAGEDYGISTAFSDTGLSLPSSVGIKATDVKTVAQTVAQLL